jgi:predicted nucleic acid-binding protein
LIDLPEELIADSSILLTWFLGDGGTEQAMVDRIGDALIEGATGLLVLDLTVYELTNVLIRRHGIPGSEVASRIEDVFVLTEEVIRIDRRLAARAAQIASSTGLSGYDAAYLAAGERVGAPVLTLDAQLAAHGAVHPRELAPG